VALPRAAGKRGGASVATRTRRQVSDARSASFRYEVTRRERQHLLSHHHGPPAWGSPRWLLITPPAPGRRIDISSRLSSGSHSSYGVLGPSSPMRAVREPGHRFPALSVASSVACSASSLSCLSSPLSSQDSSTLLRRGQARKAPRRTKPHAHSGDGALWALPCPAGGESAL